MSQVTFHVGKINLTYGCVNSSTRLTADSSLELTRGALSALCSGQGERGIYNTMNHRRGAIAKNTGEGMKRVAGD